MKTEFKRSLDRAENTFTLREADLKKRSYCDLQDGRLLFFELTLLNFSKDMQKTALKYAEEGLNIMVNIGDKKRLLMLC